MASFDISGRAALVTGAARGIGFETAWALHARGASVAVVDLSLEDTQRAAAAIGSERTLALAADVTDRAAIGAAADAAAERFGRLDIVVANAGIAPPAKTIRSLEEDVFERVVDVDLLGVYRTVRAGLPHVISARGHIVVVASVYAFVNGSGAAPYAVAKAGVEQLGRALRVELQQHGASASVAYFGFIDTEMVRQQMDSDPLADRMMAVVPAAFRKRLPPSAAGAAIVRGIERRAPRIVAPRRWIALSVLRGIVNPVADYAVERDPRVQSLAAEFDRR